MKKHIATLYLYEKWANLRILESLAQLPEPDEKALDIMAHILLVEMVWFSRINGQPDQPVWAKKTLPECVELQEMNIATLTPYFNHLTEDELARVVNYKNTKGQPFANSVAEILSHLFNHSTYHRGQIVERMKGKLPQMPVTDMIAFLRER
jgi:uncharacterized damage-inducible protein DinB